MRQFGNYTLHEDVGIVENCIYYTATERADGQTFLLKILLQHTDDIEERSKIHHEYHLLKKLSTTSHYCLHPLALLEENNYIGILFNYDQFKELASLYPRTPVPLATFFPLAINIAKALEEIHHEGIIHKNLSLKSILYNPEKKLVKISEFTIATEINRTTVASLPPRLLQGTLQYISPEQTGRMNRPLTKQTDLYSLGVIFFELLTGNPPFDHHRPMDIIMDHIATSPPDLHTVNSHIPQMLADIVKKLLAKMAEDRYQTIEGLIFDLEHAWSEYSHNQEISSFLLDQHSQKKKLELPSKLYGRDDIITKLFNAFDLVCENKSTITVTISGYSGTGKTSIVNELSRKLAVTDGFFAAGKFDKFQKSDAYEGLRVALDRLIQYKLYAVEEEYQQFKDAVLSEVGSLLSEVTDFIPRLKEIVGTPTPLPEVGIEQTKNRFQLAIQRFIKATASQHPIVLFLDDVQWASQAMLNLLSTLVLSEDLKNLLFVISYRSDEIDITHPLKQVLEIIKEKGSIEEVYIEGLTEESLNEILKDILSLDKKELSWLGSLLWRISSGNPFFILLLLEELYQDGALYFSAKNNGWKWDENKVQSIKEIHDISSFVDNHLNRLSPDVKELLHLASCIGNQFTLEQLAYAHKTSLHSLLNALDPAIKEHLLVPLGVHYDWLKELPDNVLQNRTYQFQHDKIQHGCYRLKSTDKTDLTHLKIARNWYNSYGPDLFSIRLLEITSQFNKGLRYIQTESEKELVCTLNREASKIAIKSIAYDSAYSFDTISRSLLPENAWQQHYALTFEIYLSYTESSFLTHHLIESEEASEELLKHANNVLDKAKILNSKGNLDRISGPNTASMFYFEEGLRLLGYPKIAINPSFLEVIDAAMRFKWMLYKKQASLDTLPQEVSETENLVFSLVTHLSEECYYSSNLPRYAYVLMTWAILSFHKQSRELRSCCYIIHSMLWPRSRSAHASFTEGFDTLKSVESNEQTAIFYFAGVSLHLCWYKPWSEIDTDFALSIEVSAKTGNLVFLAYSYIFHAYFPPSLSCKEVIRRYNNLRNLITDISPRAAGLVILFNQFYRQLSGDASPNCWKDDWINLDNVVEFSKKIKFDLVLTQTALFQVRSAVYFDNFSIEDISQREAALIDKVKIFEKASYPFNTLLAHFYLFLLNITLYKTHPLFKKIAVRLRMYRSYQKVRSYVKLCPANFEPYALFMKAEYARFHGRFKKSLLLYDKTIACGEKYQVPECVGLASQHAAEYCLAKGKMELAQAYMNTAIKTFTTWQAYGKVKQLSEKYPDLVKGLGEE